MLYYWKITLPAEHKVLKIYAHTEAELNILLNAWIRRQNKSDLQYTVGHRISYIKNVPADIVEQEFKHLGVKYGTDSL